MAGHYYRGSRWSSSVIWSIPIHYSSGSGRQRRWASLLRETQEPHLFSWAKEMSCSSRVNHRHSTRVRKREGAITKVINVSYQEFTRGKMNHRVYDALRLAEINKLKMQNLKYWEYLHLHLAVWCPPMLLEIKAGWPGLWGENTLWRHCVEWQAELASCHR